MEQKQSDFTWNKFHEYLDIAMGLYATETQRMYNDSSIMDLAKFSKWKYDQELVQGLRGPTTIEETEEKGMLGKIWDKTVFPQMIKSKKEKKRLQREEAKVRAEIQSEARREAMVESKDVLKDTYKQQEIDKITGKDRQNKMKKFADAFSMSNLGSTDKINAMLGRQEPVQQQPVQQQPQYQQPQQSQPQYQQPQQQPQYQQPQQQPSLTNLDGNQIANMLSGGGQRSPQRQDPASGIGQLNIPGNDKLAGMMGMGEKDTSVIDKIRPGIERKRRGRQ